MLFLIPGALLPCVLSYFLLQTTFFFNIGGFIFFFHMFRVLQVLTSLSWIDCLKLLEPSKWAAYLTYGYNISVRELFFLLLFSFVERQYFAWSLGVWTCAELSVLCEYLTWGYSLLDSKSYWKSSTIGLLKLGRSWALAFISRASWGWVNLRFKFSYFGKCPQANVSLGFLIFSITSFLTW